MELKNILGRQPGPEVAEQLAVYQENLKQKVIDKADFEHVSRPSGRHSAVLLQMLALRHYGYYASNAAGILSSDDFAAMEEFGHVRS